MARSIFQSFITDGVTGAVVEGAQITVALENGNPVTIYEQQSGGSEKVNPFLTGSDGRAVFYAEPGIYRITATFDSITSEFRYYELGTAKQPEQFLEDFGGLSFEDIAPLAKGGTGASTADEARSNLDVYRKRDDVGALSDITALSSLNTAALVDGQGFRVVSTPKAGDFVWRSGDQSAEVSSDPGQGIWVAPDSDANGASGAFERIYVGDVYAFWFGAVGDGSADDSVAIERASQFGSVILPPTTKVSSLTVSEGSSLIGVDSGTVMYCANGSGVTNITFEVNNGSDLSYGAKNIVLIAQSNGGTGIQTETSASLSTLPRLFFENLLFKGTTLGPSASVWEYNEGWSNNIIVGDCFSTRINKLNIYGTYDIESDQSLSPDDTGLYFNGATSVRGVRVTNYQTSDVKFPINVGENVTSLWIDGFDWSRSHSCVVASHVSNSAELQILNGYANAQYVGIAARNRSWTFIDNVNVTRHPNGFDHSSEWIGLDLGVDFNDASVSSMRILDPGTWLNVGTRTAVKLDDVLRTKFDGITCAASDGTLDYGFDLQNSSTDNVFDNVIFDDVDVHFNFGAGTSDISVGNRESRGVVTKEFQFDASITPTAIYDNFRLSGFGSTDETNDASLETKHILKRVTGQTWESKVATNDEYVIRDVTAGENRMEMTDGVALIKWGGTLRPLADNAYDLGSGSFRWRTVYAATGTINTSDEREKEQARDLSEAERLVARSLKSQLKAFKWKDAVSLKGDVARWHFGIMAQEVVRHFAAEGLDAHDYGLFCYDEWEAKDEVVGDNGEIVEEAVEAGNRYGVRYDELLAFILAAL